MSDEIIKQEKQLPAAPEFIQKSSDGFENVRGKDLAPPRLKLMQALSPEVQEETFSPGDVVNSISGELVFKRDQEISFVPIYHFVSWIEWGEQGEGMRNVSIDPSSEIAQAAARGEKSIKDGKETFRVTEYHNFFVIAVPLEEPMEMFHIGFAKTNYKVGRKLIGLAKMRGDYPLYAGRYKLSSDTEENKKSQKYKVFQVRNDGWVDEKTFIEAKKQYEIISKAMKEDRVQVEYETPEQEDVNNHEDGKGEF